VIAAITDADVAARIRVHLGLPTHAPDLAPARAPPQTEMFGDDDRDEDAEYDAHFAATGPERYWKR